jgi:NAD+ diphosphatase
MTQRTIAFAGSAIDRADAVRTDPERLAAVTNWRARLLRLDGLAPVIAPDGGLDWGSLADADPDAELIFLGLNGEGRAAFVAVDPGLVGVGSTAPPDPRLWQVMGMLGPEDLAVYGAAKALVDWHARHRFCPRCSHGTHLAKGGWQRTCTNAECRTDHFPRVDPVTIMTVEHDGRLLLGRQPRFPPRRYSALAGFVEPGETVEEAVAREVHEEAGVRVRDVRYIASQPWPFPSSLMIACHAFADDAALTIDRTELDDARWFTRDEVIAAMRGEEGASFIAPPPHAIAHHLLRWWLEQ